MENDTNRESQGKDRRERRGVARINAFSDAVFAVAITLLILTIDVPQISDPGELGSALRALWPKFEGFLISFVVIGAFWVSHHLIFELIERHRPLLLWINLLFLMFIVALPFSTDLMSEYNNSSIAVVFYDINLIAASLLLFLLWWYVSYRHNLIEEGVDAALRKHLLLNYLTMGAIFALSLGIAFISPSGSQYAYLLLIPNSILLERMKRRELYPSERKQRKVTA
jgi:uncharacterized membrane protein